jgi:ketosteroid isomerase-like protein
VTTRTGSAVDRVRAVFRIFLDGGPDALLERYDELFAPGFEFYPALIGTIEGERRFVGRDGFAAYWREFGSVFAEPDFSEPTYEALDDHRVLAVGRIRAKGAASGAPFDQEAGYVIEVRDGRVSEMRTFFSGDEARGFANA